MPGANMVSRFAMPFAAICVAMFGWGASAQSETDVVSSSTLGARGEYSRIELGTLPAGAWLSEAEFTNSGEVLGIFAQYNSFHVYSWSRQDGLVELDEFGGYDVHVRDMSKSGYVLFSGTVGLGGTSAVFIWSRHDGLVRIETVSWCANAHAVNDAGQVVGYDYGAGVPMQAFSWTETEGSVDLGTLGGSSSRATELSDAGQVVGWSSLPGDEQTHAFSWTSREGMIDLGTLGGSDSYAWAVSNRGHVVGEAGTVGGVSRHAFLWTAQGGMIDLGTLGGPNSYATGVNHTGVVIGVAETAESAEHGFYWTPQTGMIDIGAGAPVAINESGTVIGRDYAWSQQTGLIPLVGRAVAINSRGQILGFSGAQVVMWEPVRAKQ